MLLQPQNKKGVRIHRGCGDEASAVPKDYEEPYDTFKNYGIQVMERVYLPKKLNVEYLKSQAEIRSNEDEAALDSIDRDVYGIPADRQDARNKISEYRDRLRAGQVVHQAPAEVNEAVNEYGAFTGYQAMLDSTNTILEGLKAHNSMFIPGKKMSYSQLIENMTSIKDQLTHAVELGDNFKG